MKQDKQITWLAVVSFALLCVPDLAAQPAAATSAGSATGTMTPGQLFGVFGKPVQDLNGTDAGRLWDVLVDGDGQPRAAVIDYGGVLGVGHRKIAVEWHDLRFTPGDAAHPIHLALTKQQMGAISEFKYDNGATTAGGTH